MSKEVNINTGNQKNLIVSLLLWFFLGYGIGGHNFYLGRIGIGIFQLVLFIISWITKKPTFNYCSMSISN